MLVRRFGLAGDIGETGQLWAIAPEGGSARFRSALGDAGGLELYQLGFRASATSVAQR